MTSHPYNHPIRREPKQPFPWDSKNIEEMAKPPVKQPDLVGMHDMKLLGFSKLATGGKDERPIIIDYESGSTGRVQRIMKWADDYVPGHESKKGCCLRFEVRVIKPGRKSTHHEDDIVIWSQTFLDVMNSPTIMEFIHANGVYAKQLRETLIRDGFPDQAKEF